VGAYAVTGSYSGMGAAVVERLRAAGHQAITVDVPQADMVARLATPAGRHAAAPAVLERCGAVAYLRRVQTFRRRSP